MAVSSEALDKVPILVGIIGHRDLIPGQVEEIEAKVRASLQSIKSKYKHTPVYVVTSLAEGADTLGAKIATELEIPLVALLPMEPAEYKTTFLNPANGPLLDEYLKKARLSYVCRPARSRGPDQDDDLDSKFARSGAAVMQYSHIVIALWNGFDNGKSAGTSFLVKHAIDGIPPHIVNDLEGDFPSPLDPVSTASIRHIPIDRQADEPVSEPQFEETPWPDKFCQVRFKGKKADLRIGETKQKMFRHFNDFNRDLEKNRPKSGTWAAKAKKDDPPLVRDQDQKILPPGLVHLRERFAMASQLAEFYRERRHFRCLKHIIILAALIAFVHQVITSNHEVEGWLKLPESVKLPAFLEQLKEKYLHNDITFELETAWPYLLYGGLIFIGYAVVTAIRQRRWQQKYLDYHTIAEGVRTQFFWLIAGIRPPAVNYFLRKQMEEMEWIRSVLRLWYLRAIVENGLIRDADPIQAQLIQDHWIKKRLNRSLEESRKARNLDRKLKLWSFLLITIFFLTTIGKMIHVNYAKLIRSEYIEIPLDWKVVLTLAAAAAGALAILVSSYRYFFNTSETPKSHSQMAVLFSDANHFYDPTDRIQEAERTVLKELGRESLAEAGDWLLRNRKRKIKLPTAPIKDG